MWDDVNYPFPNYDGDTVEVWEGISNFVLHFIVHVITFPSWDWKFIYASKSGPRNLDRGQRIDENCSARKYFYLLNTILGNHMVSVYLGH